MTLQALPPYRVMCYAKNCPHEATFKIAARWSDGLIGELKTYALTCRDCLPEMVASARAKKAQCRLASGETLGEPEVFAWQRGQRDRDLLPRTELNVD